MKTFKLMISILALGLSLNSMAAYLPGWERPIKQADMKVLEAKGIFASVQNVILVQNRRDGSELEASTFTLSVEFMNSKDDLQTLEYRIPVQSVSYGSNGNDEFVGKLKLIGNDQSIEQSPEIEIKLVRDPKMTWSAQVQLNEFESSNSLSTLLLEGNPDILYTIQVLETL